MKFIHFVLTEYFSSNVKYNNGSFIARCSICSQWNTVTPRIYRIPTRHKADRFNSSWRGPR